MSDTSATAASDPLVGSNPLELLRPSAEGALYLMNPFIGVALELSSPAFRTDFGRPRAFVHADVISHFGFRQDIAREGAPDAMEAPGTAFFPERAIPGQGSTTSAQLNTPVVAVGAGVAFRFHWIGRVWRLKPSIEFIRERYDIEGVVNRAVRLTVGSNGPPPEPSTFRFIEVRGSVAENFYSLGPGIELEVDVARRGPVLLSLGLGGRFYRTLGNRQLSFSGSYTDELGSETASFTFEKDPWTMQVGVGLRFRWAPE